HGLQLWVNLPSAKKMIPPAYQNIEADLVKLVTTLDAGSIIRIIAGDIDGVKGPGSTHTPIVVAHATLSPGARMTLPWNPAYNALAYSLAGEGSVGTEQAAFGLGRLAVFGPGDTITVAASPDKSLDLLLLGGEPIGEPVEQYGPFVMNTRAELQQAFEDFQAGRLGVVPANGIRPFRGR
ncbi:MAG: pirin family protein, partial [Actinomycetota bacterium]